MIYWRLRHSSIQSTTEALINESGIIADAEPFGLFSPLIPQAALSTNADLHNTRARQGLVPDLHITFPAEHGPASSQLVEIKSLSTGATWYKSNQKTVDQRAKNLPREYRVKAHNIDTKYCGTGPNQAGPLEQHLNSFGDLLCLVAGQYGEVSQDFHNLLSKLATAKADQITRMEGRHISASERGLILHQMRRRLSVTIIRAQSSCLLSRLGHFSPGAKDAAKRRASSKLKEEAIAQDRRAHFQAHIRGRHIHEKVGALWI